MPRVNIKLRNISKQFQYIPNFNLIIHLGQFVNRNYTFPKPEAWLLILKANNNHRTIIIQGIGLKIILKTKAPIESNKLFFFIFFLF
jgi:hypothetical protein